MNRRHFLKQFGALAAAGFILPEVAKAATGYQVVIPAQGVVPAVPPGPTGSVKPFGTATTSSIKIIDAASIDLTNSPLTVTDTTADGGIFFDRLFSGDFNLSFQISPWPGLNAGILGVGVMDISNRVINTLAEFSAYSAWDQGNPFSRLRSPYTYNSTWAPLNAPLSVQLSRVNGVITGQTWWSGEAPLARQLNINTAVKPFIYYVAGGTNAGTIGFTAKLRSIQLGGS